jgi:negative regulator of replication initiation
MNSIKIDDQVLAELEKRATGFNVTPNDVLRKLLNLDGIQAKANGASTQGPLSPLAGGRSPLAEFLNEERFQRYNQAVDRYLVLLGWLYKNHPDKFPDAVLGFRRGSRRYFAKSETEILHGGDGVTAKDIPGTPFWAMTTLDNRTKRTIIEDIMRALGYGRGDINLALAALPDSGIRRSSTRARILASL